jgi:signal transduction histidine kinase
MADAVPRSYLGLAADLLEEREQAVLEAYEGLLRTIDSPLVAEGEAREQLRAQAQGVLREVVRDLRGHGQPVRRGGQEERLSAVVGASRARDNVHPSESLRAVAALSEASLSVVVEELPPSPTSRSEVAAVALAVQRSIMERVASASVAYGNYLIAKLHEAHADERRRISRELHDRVAHSIMVAFQSLELYEMYAGRDPEKARSKLELAKSTARQALTTARDLSRELRDSVAPEGLEVALSDYLRSTVPQEVRAWVSAKGDESFLTTEVRDEMYLILREAIRNAVAHSAARSIRVEFDAREYEVKASVEDDGRGFDLEITAVSSYGTGLASMRERVALLGGALNLRSHPGRGTKVEISVPLLRSSR